MKFHIRAVVLWSWDSKFQPRVIPFEPGMVNVLTGKARTGKSALIPIIDYCLCSSSCAIPRKVIRSSCEWFGVLIETLEGPKLLARKNPGERDAVDEMYILEGYDIEIPRKISTGNARLDIVKRQLDKLTGISQLDFAGGEVSHPIDHRMSFRDMMAFVFQPQNVVANRDVLFYRCEKLEYKLKLSRNILPYVLGAVTPSVMAARYELERINRELRRKVRDLERAQKVSLRWESQMSAQLAKAEELGLYSGSAPDNLSPEMVLDLLHQVALKTADDFHVDSTTISDAVERQVSLEAREDKLAAELADLKGRQEGLSRLRDGAGGYHQALLIQKDRIGVSDWLSMHSDGKADCPICGNLIQSHVETLSELKENLSMIENATGQIAEMPLAVDRETQHIHRDIDEIAEKLRDIKKQKKVITSGSKEASDRQFRALTVAHFLGQLSQAISLYDEVQDDGDLPEEISQLRVKIEELMRVIDEGGIKQRQDAALERVSNYISQHMPRLDNDHSSNAACLDVADLTLRISGPEGQSALWSIGSGSNHLSYHISTLLALHRFFLEGGGGSAVPALLVFDQPSQVYFPEKLNEGSAEQDVWKNDGDIIAVRKVFELLGDIVEKSRGRLQVIVLDHAPESVWGSLRSVTLAEDWHSEKRLVPSDWPEFASV